MGRTRYISANIADIITAPNRRSVETILLNIISNTFGSIYLPPIIMAFIVLGPLEIAISFVYEYFMSPPPSTLN